MWDEQGRLILDVTDRMGRVVGSVKTGSSSGSLVDSGFSYGEPWFMIVLEPGQYEGWTPGGSTQWRPAVTISGNTLSWTAGVPSTIVYGVY